MASSELAKLRRRLGYSQEHVAHCLGTDRTTVGRWERGETQMRGHHRRKLADLFDVTLTELDSLLMAPKAAEHPVPATSFDSGDSDDMLRRDFLRHLTVAGSIAMLPADALDEGPGWDDFEAMNTHLWRVYQLSRNKSSVRPLILDQLTTLSDSFESGRRVAELCGLTADLFQLAGELAFDGDRYTEAAHCYTLALSASREAGAYDLWACALTRHAYVGLYEGQHRQAAAMLTAAEKVAQRGDSALATRHWVAAAQAQAYAGLGDLSACERALDAAEDVARLPAGSTNGGWLRFDGSRLAEERGSRYLELGRLDLAETTLTAALTQDALARGSSFRRRAAVLADLATIGAKRREVDQVMTFGRQALELAQRSRSGYIVRRLQVLQRELEQVAHDARVAELSAEIAALAQ
ncbi:helix-turn-helix transcriptional regulator [Streptomyces sp. NPDC048290]|uniref:helix-turn-helix transcriptional regulator n=1 Tax=Streptomyces sp. NPDC048290 TaxID=3155811 RepID=UPI00343735BA